MDLSFPMPTNPGVQTESASAASTASASQNGSMPPNASRPHVSGDIVDTFWDIPTIDFPETESGRQGQDPDSPSHSFAADAATSTIPATAGGTGTPTEETETSVLSNTRLFPEGGPASRTDGLSEERTLAFDFGAVPGTDAEQQASEGEREDDDPLRLVPEPPRRSRKPVIIGIVTAVVVVAVAAAGVFLWRSRQGSEERTAALAACAKASSSYGDARDALDQVLNDTADEQAITADQVADATTVDALKTAVDNANAVGRVASCNTSLSVSELHEHADRNTKMSERMQGIADEVDSAAKSVAESRDAKTSADTDAARTALQTAVTDAQTLLDNSLWAVADDSTRVTLQDAINSATTLLQNNDADLKSLQDAQAALQSASDGVNASMEELAAANAQQQLQQQYNYGYWTGPSVDTDSGTGTDTGTGTSETPQPSQPEQPTTPGSDPQPDPEAEQAQ